MTDPFSLAGQRVIVTGGTRGIGRAIAWQLAKAGAEVVANYARNDAAAQALQAEADKEGLALTTLRADLTLAKGLEALLEQAQPAQGQVLSVVHCAATGVHRPAAELTMKHWDWTQALNVRAFFELMRALMPRLASGSAVLAVSSAGAVRAVPAYAAIGSSKGALEALARHLAVELAPRGVRVNILSPGSVATEAWESFPDKEARMAATLARTPIGRLVSLEEVARTAHFLLSPAAAGIVGQTIVVDGGARIVD